MELRKQILTFDEHINAKCWMINVVFWLIIVCDVVFFPQ